MDYHGLVTSGHRKMAAGLERWWKVLCVCVCNNVAIVRDRINERLVCRNSSSRWTVKVLCTYSVCCSLGTCSPFANNVCSCVLLSYIVI